MILPWHANHSPIAIDLGSRCVKALQLKRTAGRMTISNAAVLPLPHGSMFDRALAGDLAGLLRRQDFVGRDVVLAAPRESVRYSVVPIPLGEQLPIEKLCRMEVARAHGLKPMSFEMACWPIPEPGAGGGSGGKQGDQKQHLLVAAHSHSDADTSMDCLEDAALSVKAIDLLPGALTRACDHMLAGLHQMTLLVDAGWQSTQIIAAIGETVVFERTLEHLSKGHMYEALHNRFKAKSEVLDHLLHNCSISDETQADQNMDVCALAMKLADEMADELHICIDYLARQYPKAPAQSILLTGGGVLGGMDKHIANRLAIQTKTVTPADIVDCDPSLEAICNSPILTGTLGLVCEGNW